MWTTVVRSSDMYGKLWNKKWNGFCAALSPCTYIKNNVISATNAYAKKSVTSWKDMDFDEFLHVIGIFLAMEVHEIHGPRRLYWSNEHNGILNPAWILMKSSHGNGFKHQDQQALDFFDAVNTQFKQAVTPGSFITCDQSMIK